MLAGQILDELTHPPMPTEMDAPAESVPLNRLGNVGAYFNVLNWASE